MATTMERMDSVHSISPEELIASLRTDIERGLSESEASDRLSQRGFNALDEAPPDPAWRQFLEQFRELVVILLLMAGVIAAWLGEWADTIAIAAIVLANALIGFLQQRRAESALSALRRLSAPRARVVRDGKLLDLPARDLVVGDRVELEAGDLVPADIRLIHGFGLQIAEATLTGESVPAEKDAKAELLFDTPLGDRCTMAYSGTIVVAGKAYGIVAATGMRTELGRIASLLQGTRPEPTPLQKRLATLGRWLVFVCLGLVAIIAVLQLARGASYLETLRMAVTLAVAAIPEGLPAVVTITLAIGLKRMVERNALIRKLASVETLGSVTVICSDKTGTLTRNEMTVREIFAGGRRFEVTGLGYEPRGEFLSVVDDSDPAPSLNGHGSAPADSDLHRALTIGLRCNHARLTAPKEGDPAWRIVGDPTEGALVVAAAKASIPTVPLAVVHEIPFDSDRKRMSLVARDSDGSLVQYVKGAAEVVLARCDTMLHRGDTVAMTPQRRDEVVRAVGAMADRALRVLAVADRRVDEAQSDDEIGLTFVGLFGLVDPPRAEVKIAIAECHRAGIRPVMITGDHPRTARAIASELDIVGPGDDVVVGSELEKLTDEQLEQRVERIRVYARVSPEHKLRVVRAWKARGHVVAMTGDGVNDAPAVNAADIGIAMGIAGTDVTKQSSAMVLMDDNFASIVGAVEEGRTIYDNIKKAILYLLAGNANKLIVMFVAVVLGWHEPLLALQILWLNLVTDGLPALALGMEAPVRDLMDRPPRSPQEGLITGLDGATLLVHGCLLAAVSLVAFVSFERYGLSYGRTAAFCVVGLSQLAYALTCRSRRYTCFQLGFFSNKPLLAAVAISAMLQVSVMLLPFAQPIFGIDRPLNLTDWAILFALAILPAAVIEGWKMFRATSSSSGTRATFEELP